jgi:hypothetical protein
VIVITCRVGSKISKIIQPSSNNEFKWMINNNECKNHKFDLLAQTDSNNIVNISK